MVVIKNRRWGMLRHSKDSATCVWKPEDALSLYAWRLALGEHAERSQCRERDQLRRGAGERTCLLYSLPDADADFLHCTSTYH